MAWVKGPSGLIKRARKRKHFIGGYRTAMIKVGNVSR